MPNDNTSHIFPIFGGPNPGRNHRHLPKAPPWRQFKSIHQVSRKAPAPSEKDRLRAKNFRCDNTLKVTVSAALALRRPLLITGSPGTGKSTLAYAVAYDLGLGAVLRWNITSRSTLRDGLYSYDALDRLNEASLRQSDDSTPLIGDFIKLGPLGTALLPTTLPRVLLIDELDKSDIDLPNDLLNIFEEGSFEIPELLRSKEEVANVRPNDVQSDQDFVTISGGKVACRAFPIVFLTSNKEREFSPAFLRRCVRYHFGDPEPDELRDIAMAHLKELSETDLDLMINAFEGQKSEGLVATDQLLNALFLLSPSIVGAASLLDESAQLTLRDTLLEALSRSGVA